MIWFTIYTTANHKCPYCEKAARLLTEAGLAFHWKALSLSELAEQMDKANMKTVPIVYHGVRLIGGYTELAAYLS